MTASTLGRHLAGVSLSASSVDRSSSAGRTRKFVRSIAGRYAGDDPQWPVRAAPFSGTLIDLGDVQARWRMQLSNSASAGTGYTRLHVSDPASAGSVIASGSEGRSPCKRSIDRSALSPYGSATSHGRDTWRQMKRLKDQWISTSYRYPGVLSHAAATAQWRVFLNEINGLRGHFDRQAKFRQLTARNCFAV
jgi:hypothetical protein